jgi:hypothetical protein
MWQSCSDPVEREYWPAVADALHTNAAYIARK